MRTKSHATAESLEQRLQTQLREEGLTATRWSHHLTAAQRASVLRTLRLRRIRQVVGWSNGPHAVYGVHAHPYAKTLFVIEGSITFTLARPGSSAARRAGEDTGRRVAMTPGNRLDLPPHTPHSAVVGPEGVVCLEAHLKS